MRFLSIRCSSQLLLSPRLLKGIREDRRLRLEELLQEFLQHEQDLLKRNKSLTKLQAANLI